MENGEIDLIDLYGAFKKTTTYRTLSNTYSLIISNKIWFIAFILIGAAGGYYLNTTQAPLYKCEMLVESSEINNYVSQNMIAGLNSLINQKNHTELIKKNINKELSLNIQNIEVIPSKIKNEDQNIFKLILHSYSIDSLKQIENALINYLNNNDYSAKFNKENLDQLVNEKNELLSEVYELDSLNSLMKKQLNSNQKQIYTSPASISQEKTIAKVRIIELERLILNSNNYHILNGFTPTNSPEPKKGNYPIKGAFLSFLLGLIILRIFKK